MGAFAVIASAAAWGMSGIFITIIANESQASSIGLAFWRDLLGCITFLVFTLFTHPKNLRIHKKDLAWIISMGAGLGSFHILYNQSILLNGTAVTTVQQAAMPAVVCIAALYLWKEALTREKIISMGIIFLGTTMASGLDIFDLEKTNITGLTVGFTVPFFYAAWTLLGKRVVPIYGATASLAVAFGIASLMLLPLQPFVAQPFPLTPAIVSAFCGLILLSTFGGFFLYMTALKYIQAGVAATLVMSEILFAGSYAFFFLGEGLTMVQLLGAALVIAGVVWLSYKQKTPEAAPENVYIKLQQHLDRQPVGFPATKGQSEIRILKHIFTPKQAEIATCLTHRPESIEIIHGRACQLIPSHEVQPDGVPSIQALEITLNAMVKKGGIEIHKKNNITFFANAPLVVGMYELQLDRLTPEFIMDFKTYSSDKKFGLAFLGTRLPQMRTIPIQKSIPYQTRVSTFDEINILLEKTLGPFVILPCICRKKKSIQGSSCKVTQRTETCLALGDIGQSAIEMGMGREISRDEAITIIDQNQKEGLVLQPSNAQTPDFICSCCACCCGMLSIQKSLPSPLHFWASNFQAEIDKNLCNGCGICEKRCQADAIILPPLSKKTSAETRTAAVDKNRCLGCGLCVPTCPANAVTLVPKPIETRPPETRQELYEILLAGKKDPMGQIKLFGRLAKDMIRTGDLGLIKKDQPPMDL